MGETLSANLSFRFVLCKPVRWNEEACLGVGLRMGDEEEGRKVGRLTPCMWFQSETSGVW